MALVLIPMSSMVVMRVVTVLLVRAFPVSSMRVVIGTFCMVTMTVGLVTVFIILITTVIRTSFLVLMTLGILLFVSIPLSRFALPIIGKCNTGAAKYYNDYNVKYV